MKSVRWGKWQFVPGDWTPSPAALAETLDGGQAFRWFRPTEPSVVGGPGEGGAPATPEPVWTGVWGDCVAQLRQRAQMEWRAPAQGPARTAEELPRYLGLDCDWRAHEDQLPWRSDPHLAECLRAFPGLRLLRQPFGETLLGFLCSATKQIVQIKQMLALLAERHGAEIAPGFSRLPTWGELAMTPEADLRDCRLGFRARFIHQTARLLAEHPCWMDETEQMPYAAAKERLLSLPGVGEKVADCVLLFGAGRLEAFPVDTWMLKSLARRYRLAEWKPAQLAQFGRAHFGPGAGLAQQYLFAWERKFGGR
jgi:N-glycosylase/DNA lyase